MELNEIVGIDKAFAWSFRKFGEVTKVDRKMVRQRFIDAGLVSAGLVKGYETYWCWDGLRAIYAPEATSTGEKLDPEKMGPKDRKDYYDSEQRRIDVETKQGLLVSYTEYEDQLAPVVQAMAIAMDNMPSILEREHNLPPEQVETVEKSFDELREGMANTLRELSGVESQSSE